MTKTFLEKYPEFKEQSKLKIESGQFTFKYVDLKTGEGKMYSEKQIEEILDKHYVRKEEFDIQIVMTPNEVIEKQKVKDAINKVVLEYQENDNLDWQDENKQDLTPRYWLMRLEEELGLED